MHTIDPMDETRLAQFARDAREEGLLGEGPLLGRDSHGRSLWHAAIAFGSHMRPDAIELLRRHVPLGLDAAGRGILPSLWALRERELSASRLDPSLPAPQRDWLPMASVSALCMELDSTARSWFACPDPAEASRMADWIANRHEGRIGGHLHFDSSLSLWALRVADTLDDIAPPILGALAFNFAVARLPGNDKYLAKELALAERMLSLAGGPGPLAEINLVAMEARAHPAQAPLMRLLRASFERSRLAAEIPQAPGRSIKPRI